MGRQRKSNLDRFMDEFVDMSDAEQTVTIQQLTWAQQTARRIAAKQAPKDPEKPKDPPAGRPRTNPPAPLLPGVEPGPTNESIAAAMVIKGDAQTIADSLTETLRKQTGVEI